MLGKLRCGCVAEKLFQQFALAGRIVHHRHGRCLPSGNPGNPRGSHPRPRR
jgi:hypothetical protein